MKALMQRAGRLVHLGLLLAGVLIAYAAWRWAPYQAIVAASLSLSQTSLIAATAIWALREKAEDGLIDAEASAHSIERAGDVVRQVLQPKFVRRAVFTVVMVGLVGVPAATGVTSKAVWEWSVYAGAVGLAECAYSFLLASLWNTQIREHRAEQALAVMRRKEFAAQRRALESPTPSTAPTWGLSSQGALSKA